MMKWVSVTAAVVLLSACGVDGEPETPTAEPAPPPPVVEPTVAPSVSVSPSGIRATSGLGVKIGGVRVGLGV